MGGVRDGASPLSRGCLSWRVGVFYRDLMGRFLLSSVKSSLERRVSGMSLFPYLRAEPQRGVVSSRWRWDEGATREVLPARPLQRSPLSGDQVEVVAQGGVVAAQLLRGGVFARSFGFGGVGVHQRSQAGEQD